MHVTGDNAHVTYEKGTDRPEEVVFSQDCGLRGLYHEKEYVNAKRQRVCRHGEWPRSDTTVIQIETDTVLRVFPV